MHTKINEHAASLPEQLALLIAKNNSDFCDARKVEHVDCTHSSFPVDHIASVRLTEDEDNQRILIYTLNGDMTRCFFAQPFDQHVGADLAEHSVGAATVDTANIKSSAKELARVITGFYGLLSGQPRAGNDYASLDFC